MNFEDIHSIEDLAVVSEEVVWQHFGRLAVEKKKVKNWVDHIRGIARIEPLSSF